VTRVLVLGSTGSIGVQALQVIDAAPDLEAVGLSCGVNAEAMAEQAAPAAAGPWRTAPISAT
jgi:1-deoxy-D-xylulose-5-phosphate reductoisomerase